MAMTDFLDEQPERPAGWLELLSRLLNAALATFNGGPELSYDRARSLQLYRLLLIPTAFRSDSLAISLSMLS